MSLVFNLAFDAPVHFHQADRIHRGIPMNLSNGHFHRQTIFAAGISFALFASILGCRGPELRINSREILNQPLFLMVRLPEGPDREAREKILRDDLNATLGVSRSLVRAEDRKERDPILWIDVQEIFRGDVSKKTVSEHVAKGAGTGTRAGFATGAYTVSAFNNGPPSNQEAKNNLVFVAVTTAAGAAIGTVAGTVGGVSEGVVRGAYHDARLGYRPKHLICRVSYAPDGTTTPHQIGSTDAWAVIKEMRPMSNGDAHDIQKLHAEEARALSVVVDRILAKAGAMER